MSLRLGQVCAAVLAGLLLAAGTAAAQSAMAGTVRDTTGAVLPGVTVEVTSPVLIEKVRTAVTDQTGQYRVIDLRPGTYTIVFTLVGFGTVRREGIVLEANFTAPINAELRIGGIEETLTVRGESPIVDVQNTLRRDVVNRELLDALPTGRDFQTIGNVLPSVNMGRFDVGGSSTAQSGTLVAFGSRGADFQLQIDGMSASITFGEGWFNGMYHNEGVFEEMSYTLSGGSAETQSGGVTVNMIPRSGGNAFRVEALGTFTNHRFQGQNIDEALRARGFNPSSGGLDKAWDSSGSVGGPILRDRLWFFASGRHWGFSENVPNVFWKDGHQASDDTKLKAANVRLTTQLGNTRLTGSYDNVPRWRRHFGIENRGGAPESFAQYPNETYVTQLKATTTLSPRLLVEAGFTRVDWWSQLQAQPGTRLATCLVAFAACPAGTDYGDIRKTDLTLGWNYNAPTNPESVFASDRNTGMASLSYVTGTHNLKIGYTHSSGGRLIETPLNNGGLIQRYRLGVPDSVQLQTFPSVQDTKVDREIGAYVQDSWTMGRLTLNPGLRFDHFKGSVAPQTAPAGRFLPERRFTSADYVNIPTFTNASPRFGAAYD
ncbi:MAG: TonB-dependent receptor, partial [Gemmatimonadetes bacterium]|nr:TonB-dependent receptor [Gemmatimonadota bacterium]